jgi:hypothetical protein
MTETLLSTSNVLLFGRVVTDLAIARQDGDDGPGDGGPGGGGPGDGGPGGGGPGGGGPGGGDNPGLGHDPSQGARRGRAHWLWRQLEKDDATFARIYGFSYDGAYFDLPRPVLFLVHGPGEPAVQSSNITGASQTEAQLARAPQKPSLSGIAAAEFGIADDIRVWSYDKADYTIRMDVETGMFEQVLLEIFFDEGGWGRVSGAKVSGAKVSGAKVSGAKVSGAKLSGMRFRGDPTD